MNTQADKKLATIRCSGGETLTIWLDGSGVYWLEYKGDRTSYECAMAQDNPWDHFRALSGAVEMPLWERIHDVCTCDD